MGYRLITLSKLQTRDRHERIKNSTIFRNKDGRKGEGTRRMKAWGRTEIAIRDYKKLFSPIHIPAPQSAMERESHSSPSFVSILSFFLWFSLSGMYCNVLLDLQSRVTNLSILRWISVAERRRHDHHQRFVLKIDDVVIRHAHDLKRYRGCKYPLNFQHTHTQQR